MNAGASIFNGSPIIGLLKLMVIIEHKKGLSLRAKRGNPEIDN